MTSKTVKLVSIDVRYKSSNLIILPFEENAITNSKASAKIRHFDEKFAHDFSQKTANTKYLTFINHLMKSVSSPKQYGDEIVLHSSIFRALEQRIFRVQSSFKRRCLTGGPR